MADVKISALPAATTPLAGTEVLPIVQSGVTVNVAVSNLTAGRAVALGATTISSTLGVTGAATLSSITMSGGINSARGNITQHATTMDFFAVTSPDNLDGTGAAVTITSCVNAPQAGATRKFYPLAATVCTNGATFDIVGNANLTAAAGDCWIIEAKTVSTYRVSVVKEDGTAVVAGGSVLPQGRLTLTTAVPVTTSDVTAATTLYYTPYQGDKVPIYDGTSFTATTFTELSQATTDSTKSPAAVAASKVYDIFVWNDSGTIRCTRGPAWTNDTTRGYTLTLTNGIFLNTSLITNGPAALRGTFVGTVYSNASSQLNDSAAKRHVWNAYNRVTKSMACATETANSWSYATATIRQANANTANQLDYVCGAAEDCVTARADSSYANDSAGEFTGIGIGVDSTTAFVTNSLMAFAQIAAANTTVTQQASWNGVPGVGRHFITWLERGSGAGTNTWYGDRGLAYVQSGINGTVRA
ncbi:hypothetical protein UFOVP374_29 [uncultured Caudovirales phage]|uniref:Uncharacterized protein n=1 Tax=uncultured Caudovirales phage TaxID=2100421 RepID=A0A6J7X0V1_9CAUD|nr:hypothetical protein UFOVP374_29 [uncultured Caudovirales phage]